MPIPVLEIGGTHVAAALVDLTTRTMLPGGGHRDPLRAHGSAEEIIDAVLRCAARLTVSTPRHWAVALPGPFDHARGIALFEDVGKFDSLRGMDLGSALRAGLSGPASAVTFLNDATAFSVGEWIAGSAFGHRRAVGVTLGTGIGSCFLADGQVIDTGPAVPPEGRADLLTWRGRPLEDTVSRRAIRARYAECVGTPTAAKADVHTIAAAARTGDPVAAAVIEYALHSLGCALGPWLARFRASVLVVGGSIAASWDQVEPPLREGLRAADVALADLSVLAASRPVESAFLGAAHCAARRWAPRCGESP